MIKLTDSEWKIIDLLWKNGPMTLMQITYALAGETDWSKSTVFTFLKRMEDRGAVYRIEGDKTKVYYPKVDRSQASLEETKSFLDKVYEGKIGLMISNLIKEEALSNDEIDELYKILQDGDK